MELYLLDHRHQIDDEYYDTKLIGIYSSQDAVTDRISEYSELPGFSGYRSGFRVETFAIRRPPVKGTVYIATITQTADDDEITVGYRVYAGKLPAVLSCIRHVFAKPCKTKRRFYVEKYRINEDDWSEGFVSAD